MDSFRQSPVMDVLGWSNLLLAVGYKSELEKTSGNIWPLLKQYHHSVFLDILVELPIILGLTYENSQEKVLLILMYYFFPME